MESRNDKSHNKPIKFASLRLFKASEKNTFLEEKKSVSKEASIIKHYLMQDVHSLKCTFLNAIQEKNVPLVRAILKANPRFADDYIWIRLDTDDGLGKGLKSLSIYQYIYLLNVTSKDSSQASKAFEISQLIFKSIGLEKAKKQIDDLSQLEKAGQSALLDSLKTILKEGKLAQETSQEIQDSMRTANTRKL